MTRDVHDIYLAWLGQRCRILQKVPLAVVRARAACTQGCQPRKVSARGACATSQTQERSQPDTDT
eukprot:330595-Alexandrium_andersonii.AAC.1